MDGDYEHFILFLRLNANGFKFNNAHRIFNIKRSKKGIEKEFEDTPCFIWYVYMTCMPCKNLF
jgi:hypothetical protein